MDHAVDLHAWAESPLQVLGVVEAHAAGLLGERAVLHGRAGLEPVRRTITELDRTTTPPIGLRLQADSTGLPRTATRLALGDALSGQAQRMLLRRSVAHVVLLDDGRATRVVLERLVDGRPLLRPQHRASASRTLLGRLATGRLRGLAERGRLTVFTALDLDPDLVAAAGRAGVVVRTHRFSWLRGQPTPPPPAPRTVVLGSALVANGLVDARPYLRWVSELALAAGSPAAARPGASPGLGVAYLAHRREDARTLGPLREATGIDVHDGQLPVELLLRGLGGRHVVHSLPSTAAHTVRLLCPATTVLEHPVEPSWWLPAADATVRRHLSAAAPGPTAAELAEVMPPVQGRGRRRALTSVSGRHL